MSVGKKEREIVIYICDDEGIWQKEIEDICSGILKSGLVPFRILLGGNGKEVIACSDSIDILILDIEMPEMNGIQVKNWMQQKNRNTSIIFVTNHVEHMREAFGFQVYGFVDKGNAKDELSFMLPQLIKRICGYVMIDGIYDSREILYLQARGRYTELITCDMKYTVCKGLKELEQELVKAGFVRTHRSYMVNMNEITGRITDTVLVGREHIPVSARLRRFIGPIAGRKQGNDYLWDSFQVIRSSQVIHDMRCYIFYGGVREFKDKTIRL